MERAGNNGGRGGTSAGHVEHLRVAVAADIDGAEYIGNVRPLHLHHVRIARVGNGERPLAIDGDAAGKLEQDRVTQHSSQRVVAWAAKDSPDGAYVAAGWVNHAQAAVTGISDEDVACCVHGYALGRVALGRCGAAPTAPQPGL